MSATDERGLSTARAVLQVLSFVAESPSGVSASEVALRLHKSRSTAYHLLASLEAEGYVARDGRSGHHQLVVDRPGCPAPAPGPPPHHEPGFERALRTTMRQVFTRTCRRTSIGWLSASGVEPLAELGRQGIPRMGNLEKPRIQRTAHALAIGKIALAALDEDGLARHVSELGLRAYTDGTIVDPSRLRAELDQVRTSGIAVDRGEYDADFGSIAATVSGGDGRPAAALAVTVTRAQFAAERDVLAQQLLRAAAGLAAGLCQAPSEQPL